MQVNAVNECVFRVGKSVKGSENRPRKISGKAIYPFDGLLVLTQGSVTRGTQVEHLPNT